MQGSKIVDDPILSSVRRRVISSAFVLPTNPRIIWQKSVSSAMFVVNFRRPFMAWLKAYQTGPLWLK